MNTEVKKHIQEVLKRSSDFHNVYTPFELCEEMINKLPEVNKDMNIMAMFNLEFLWVLRQKLGREGINNIWFMTPCEYKKKAAIGMGINENNVIKYSYNTKEIKEKEKMSKKFDCVIQNPPYKGTLHLKFLELGFDMLKEDGQMVIVHPSAWLIDERKTNALYERMKSKINDFVTDITFFNGNPIFNIALFTPLIISNINKQNTVKKIKLIDKIKNKEYFVSHLNLINKWNEYEIYPSLREKILNIANTDNFEKRKNQKYGQYIVNFSCIRGNVDMKSFNKMFTEDFYTLIPRDRSFDTKILNEDGRGESFFSFATEIEADNFLKFIKTQFAMFALSIFKMNQNASGSYIASVPWLDFSQNWTDESLYKYFKLSLNEIEFIEKNIPEYYEKGAI